MNKIIMLVIVSIVFFGCSENQIYGAGKTIYGAGKTAYVKLPVPKNKKLENIDKVAKAYDKTRTAVIDAIKSEKDKKKLNVSSTQVQKPKQK